MVAMLDQVKKFRYDQLFSQIEFFSPFRTFFAEIIVPAIILEIFSQRMFMKKLIFASLIILPAVGFSKIKTDNCGSYGPETNNLTVLIDDEGSNEILRIGYDVIGTFFEFKVNGCTSMTFDNKKNLYCDNHVVGAIENISVSTDDLGYSGPRAGIKLNESDYVVFGSCQPRDQKPLTIAF